MTLKKRLPIVALLFFMTFSVFGQNMTTESIHEKIQQHTNEIFDSLVKIRRDFHQYPELSGQEERTAKKIENYLKALGLEVKTNIGGYGVVGILKGTKEGKQIAWRADIDALASEIPDVVDFPSKNIGVRHICGHDVHTAIGLGIANVLASQKENLAGTIYFIFQPSEENLKGAKAMINDGLFDRIEPDEIYGIHMSPWPTGTIATKHNELYASADKLQITFDASVDKDAVSDYLKKRISVLNSVPKDNKFWNFDNLGNPEIGIENPNTIYKDYILVGENINVQATTTEVIVSAEIESSSSEKMPLILKELQEDIMASVYGKKLRHIDFTYKENVVSNDEELTNATVKSIAAIYGKEAVIRTYGIMPGRADDFADFQSSVPGVYYFLGGADYEKNMISMPHAPYFAVDENSIKVGVNFFSSMIVERLRNE